METPVAVAWDGLNHVMLFELDPLPGATGFLVADGEQGRAVIVGMTGLGGAEALSALLPEGCRTCRFLSVAEGDVRRIVSIELDELFLPETARGTEAETWLLLDSADGAGLAIAREGSATIDGKMQAGRGLNLLASSGEGRFRLRVGVFSHPDDSGSRVVDVHVSHRAGDMSVRLPAVSLQGPQVVAVHVPARLRAARRDLAAMDPMLRSELESSLEELARSAAWAAEIDVEGGLALQRDGYRLLWPGPFESDAAIEVPDWSEGDELLLLAAPGRYLLWRGDDAEARAVPRLAIRSEGGRVDVRLLGDRDAARSSATGLVVAGGDAGGQAVSLFAGDSIWTDDLSLRAMKAGEAAWAATRGVEAGSGRFGDMVASHRPAGFGRSGSDLLTRLAAMKGLDEDAIVDLALRDAIEQIAFLLWSEASLATTQVALAQRLLLPMPRDGVTDVEVTGMLDWMKAQDLPQRLQRLGLSHRDRRSSRLLLDVAGALHRQWLPFELVSEARAIAVNADPGGFAGPTSALDMVLADLRSRPSSVAVPRDLETLSRLRAELPAAARAAGYDEAFLAELAAAVPRLGAAEIGALHDMLTMRRREQAQLERVRALVSRLERAAGIEGLAAAAHRNGDVMAGAMQLALSSRSMITQMSAIEALRPVLDRLDRAIATQVDGDGGETGQSRALRLTLSAYARLLLLRVCLREADTALGLEAGAEVSSARAASLRRLRGGVTETLPRYLALAAGQRIARWGEALADAAQGEASS